MSPRRLHVLGTASAVPTRTRNHNGYLLRWDTHGILLDPGEGTQRQMRLARIPATTVTRVCITHFHGDHCLGLPGLIQRLSRDRVPHPVRVAYPGEDEQYWHRLRHACPFHDTTTLIGQPLHGPAPHIPGEDDLTITALPLDHSIACYGYRITEPDGWRMDPRRLHHHGVHGPQIAQLQRQGTLTTDDGHTLTLADCATPRRGQVFAFVMDTRTCTNALTLAHGADMLVIEATYLDAQADLARAHGHLTARQAARIAASAGARTLVLTHLSERYETADHPSFLAQAAAEFDGPTHLAADLDQIPLPPRPD
ncbi:ribonuclease Z [Nocardiopsis sp. LOL_012]|uniref:ribonuclease Z n=1 Tax=Nocardiopsis sp. LOL_012 TaxID=3345409 RepID=UPI003A8B0934